MPAEMPSETSAEPRPETLGAVARPDWRANLLMNVDELVAALKESVGEASSTNAFLLAVAIDQILDDHAQPESLLERASAFAAVSGAPGASAIGRMLAECGRWRHRVRLSRHPGTSLASGRQPLTEMIEQLAAIVIERSAPLPGENPRLVEIGERVSRFCASRPASFRARTPVLPSCFQSFDLTIDDIKVLADRIIGRFGTAPTSLAIVGVRTSGSYLAPLLAAALRTSTSLPVTTFTVRPGIALVGKGAARARTLARDGARFIVTDDPPVTGSSLARAISQLRRAGVDKDAIWLTYPEFLDAPRLLQGLEHYPTVVLPWAEWAVHGRLAPTAVRADLAELLGGTIRVDAVELVEQRRPTRAEAHVRACYRISVTSNGAEESRQRRIAVEGVGIGYYGQHVTAVAAILADHAPEIIGLQNGLLYREWFEDADNVERMAIDGQLLAARLADYVIERRRHLPVAGDRSLGLAGSRPVWEVASLEISQSFGRGWPLAQTLAANAVVRRILSVSSPTVIDGSMDLENWFVSSTSAGSGRTLLRSVGLQCRAFWHHGLSSYDPVFDLAGAMDAELDVPFAPEMLTRYTDESGDRVSAERWMLLRLAQLWGHRRRRPEAAIRSREAASRVVQAYFADVFFRDLGPAGDVALCALDVDGVLETEHLGFASLTTSSALALRFLRQHGYRPVLATGRSIVDVRDRCRRYGLVGGVAEYGAALYLNGTDEMVDLLDDSQRAAVATLRSRLEALPDVVVDGRHRYAIRAWALSGNRRGPLSSTEAAAVARGLDLRIVQGDGQSDFVPTSLDKGKGLRALIGRLGASGSETEAVPIAFAVGDTASDAPMLALAAQRGVPAHATGVVPAGTLRARRPYQAGLLELTSAFLGHSASTNARTFNEMRSCSCSSPVAGRDRTAFLHLLSGVEAGQLHGLGHLVRAMT